MTGPILTLLYLLGFCGIVLGTRPANTPFTQGIRALFWISGCSLCAIVLGLSL